MSAMSRSSTQSDVAPAPPTSCPVCMAPTRAIYPNLYDDRYGYPGRFMLRLCNNCGHRHALTRFTPAEILQLYTQFYPRGRFAIDSFTAEVEQRGFKSWAKGDRASAFRWVPRNVRVLDIGCGMGTTLAYHRNRGCEAVGVEADENVRPIAERYGLDIHWGIFNAAMFPPASFDYVTLDQVAEHVGDPLSFFRDVAQILKPGGKVIVTTPNANSLGARLFGRRWLHWHTPYHLQFFTSRSMQRVAKHAGLEFVSRKVITASDWQYHQWRHALAYPKFGQVSDYWAPVDAPHGNFQEVGFLLSLAQRLRLPHLISRLLDSFGLGDSQLFVLRKP